MKKKAQAYSSWVPLFRLFDISVERFLANQFFLFVRFSSNVSQPTSINRGKRLFVSRDVADVSGVFQLGLTRAGMPIVQVLRVRGTYLISLLVFNMPFMCWIVIPNTAMLNNDKDRTKWLFHCWRGPFQFVQSSWGQNIKPPSTLGTNWSLCEERVRRRQSRLF